MHKKTKGSSIRFHNLLGFKKKQTNKKQNFLYGQAFSLMSPFCVSPLLLADVGHVYA